jgi:glycerophosphoryl diester phosphodiesterase
MCPNWPWRRHVLDAGWSPSVASLVAPIPDKESCMPQAALSLDHPMLLAAPAVLNVAHRGASCSAPENTVAAVHRAADQQADLIEVDVRLSRDGVPILLHDEGLTRTTDARRVFANRAPWHVGDFDHDELLRLDAGSWRSSAFAGERLATLDEVMDVARVRGLGVLVELKSPRTQASMLPEVAAVVRRQLPRSERFPVVVQSFDHEAMREFKSCLPSVPVGLLGAPAVAELAALSEWADQVNPHHLSATPAYVEAVHRHSMRCHVWTVNRRRSMRRALRLHVDGVITNRPQVLREVVDESLGAV